ncbi:hypothetical protein A2765_05790 [Candidatus Kaiserbacteria bacterium RIFCSPHIGHO2_01_FULL_56_24]|uniref:Uncharacterized protein n=1 Tax=Candidatus Kaiserbacteria bacterium RIFCSPHIGHO2_01_FULL_56_24 TaxID=1798487 RepID=A0A1F6DAP0_9BACT|nr:MAG: hypothetical protein A2765_05790 [Candidatus Kaiserbacteria bacterium RIFCSPHIGHO2_01_FULL_56_24]
MKDLEVGEFVQCSEKGLEVHNYSTCFQGVFRVTRIEDKPEGRWVNAEHTTRCMSSWAPQTDFVRMG